MRRTRVWLGVGLAAVAVSAVLALWSGRGARDDGEVMRGTGSAAAVALGHGAGPGERGPALSGRVSCAGSAASGAIVVVRRIERVAAESPPLLAIADARGAWASPSLAAGEYQLAATAPGCEPSARGPIQLGDADLGGLDFALAPGGVAVRGRVTDIGGGAVAGAHVTAIRAAGNGRREIVAAALTGSDGDYQLALAGGAYLVTAGRDDYVARTLETETVAPIAPLDFVLVPAATIRGVVIARDTGQPVPGARVYVPRQLYATYADDAGVFALGGLPAGAHELKAIGHGYASGAPLAVEVGLGEQRADVRLALDPSWSIRGRVVRAEPPDPGVAGVAGVVGVVGMVGVPGVAVVARSRMMNLEAYASALAPTGSDGAFEVVGARAGVTYELSAEATGKRTTYGVHVSVIDRDVDGIVLPIEEGVTLHGRVDPPGFATVELRDVDDPVFVSWQASDAAGASDAHGVFELHGLPAVRRLDVLATSPDGSRGEVSIDTTRPPGEIVVHLEPRASISGRVVDAAGRPVARAEATVLEKNAHGHVTNSLHARTRADGSFRIGGLDGGSYGVGAGAPDADADAHELVASTVDLVLAPAEARTGVVVTLSARDAVLAGRVVTAAGQPAADAVVTAERPSMEDEHGTPPFESAPVIADADGRFTIRRLEPGAYTVTAVASRGDARVSQAGVATGGDVTLTLAPLGRLAVRLIADGAPVAPYDLTCRAADGVRQRHVTASDGRVVLDRLVPDSIRCSATSQLGTASGSLTTVAGAASLELVTERWATASGTVVDVRTGRPLPGIGVSISSGTLWTDASDNDAPATDAQGRFTVSRLPPGDGTLAFGERRFLPLGGADYHAAPGEHVDLGSVPVVAPVAGPQGTLGLALGGDLTLYVLHADGPAAKAGIVSGDVLVAVDGRAAAAGEDLPLLMLFTIAVGQRVELTLARGVTIPVVAVPE